MEVRKCEYCGREFVPRKNQKFCTPLCGVKANKHEKTPQKCVICGAEFIPWNNRQKTCGKKECTKAYSNENKKKYRGAYKYKKPPIVDTAPKKKERPTGAKWEKLSPCERWAFMTWDEIAKETARCHLKYGQAQVLKERGELPEDFGKEFKNGH